MTLVKIMVVWEAVLEPGEELEELTGILAKMMDEVDSYSGTRECYRKVWTEDVPELSRGKDGRSDYSSTQRTGS